MWACPGSCAWPVHPRSRGEHVRAGWRAAADPGSSPLARGTRTTTYGKDAAIRFIPARAGNTTPTRARRSPRTVHPRSRGEHAGGRSGGLAYAGSSPLARGTLEGRWHGHPQRRFIPARAGNTWDVALPGRFTAVHPRSRGEHGRARRGMAWLGGSSPLARGTRRHRFACRMDARFIPARAGNTFGESRHPPPPTVHPRSRGEHTQSAAGLPGVDGSSPLARGTR